MAKAKKRRAKKRQAAKREHRDPATPETLQKLRPDPMDILVRRGVAAKGIEEHHFDSLWEIAQASRVVSGGVDFPSETFSFDRVDSDGSGEPSKRDIRLWNIYNHHFGPAFLRATYTAPRVVREWVEGDRQLKETDVPLLLTAAKIWDNKASDYDKAEWAKRNAEGRVLTAA